MRTMVAVFLLMALLWLAAEAPREQKELGAAAEQLQGAMEDNAVCAAIFGWEEPATHL